MANKANKQSSEINENAKEEKLGIFSYLRLGESYTSLILGIIVVIIATVLLLAFVHNNNNGNTNATISEEARTTVSVTHKLNEIAKQAPKSIVDAVDPTSVPTQKPTPTIAPTKAPQATVTPKPTMIAKAEPTKVPQVKTEKDNNVWTVQKGESLWSIAEKKYNSGFNWVDIARVNNLSNPREIHAGDKLKLPSVSSSDQTIATVNTHDENQNKTVQKKKTKSISSMQKNAQPNAPNSQMAKISGKTYDVVRGDTLWDIAERAYGTGDKWVDIARANNLVNPRVIHSGNHFTIPR